MDAYHECGIENNGGDSCRIFREVFAHVAECVQNVLDEKDDISTLNEFVKDAVVGELVNPRVTSV